MVASPREALCEVGSDRIRLIGPVLKDAIARAPARAIAFVLTAKLSELAGAAGTGQFFFHLSLVAELVGDKLRVIHIGETHHTRFIFFF